MLSERIRSWRGWPALFLGALILAASHALVWEIASSPSAYRPAEAQQNEQSRADTKRDALAALFGDPVAVSAWSALTLTLITGFLAYIAASQHNTIRRESRAYVFPQKITPEVVEMPNELPVLIVAIHWENTGKTPARRVVTDANHMVMDGQLPKDFAFRCFDLEGQRSCPIGPGHTAPVERTIDGKDFIEVSRNSKRMCVWGWIEYNDAFLWTRRRRTEFATEIRIVGRWGEEGSHMQPIILDTFNGADGDCVHRPRTKG